MIRWKSYNFKHVGYGRNETVGPLWLYWIMLNVLVGGLGFLFFREVLAVKIGVAVVFWLTALFTLIMTAEIN